MFPADAISAIAALFIVAMVWLRTRLHYARAARGPLTRAGVIYFTALLLLLTCGWLVAPEVARRIAPHVPVAPALARVLWFLGAYYLFIPMHRVLKARGAKVFSTPPG